MTRNILLVLCCGWVGSVQAQTCSMTNSTSTLVDFGVYQSLGSGTDAVGTLSLSCTPAVPLVPVSYSLSIGTGVAATFNPRHLAAGGYWLTYNLFIDPTRLVVWGDGSAGTQKKAGTCLGACAVTVYGRVFGGQSVPAMRYRDDVLVTLDF